jgi:hypothetical protein
MNPKITMREIVTQGETSGCATVRQYAKHLVSMLDWCGKTGPDLAALDGDLATYLALAPKYSKHSALLVADIARKNWKPATYKQYQSDGRRMVEHSCGDLAARSARRAQQDDWTTLAARSKILADAGLFDAARLRRLARITDRARASGLESSELTVGHILSMRENSVSAKEWNVILRGARLLDDLARFPTLRALLPKEPVGNINLKWRIATTVPIHLRIETDAWVRAATTIVPVGVKTPEAHKMMTTQHSQGSIGIFTAAIRSYVYVLGQKRDLTGVNGLAALFDGASIETVIVHWIRDHERGRKGALSPRTIYQYADMIRLTLTRNGCPNGAEVICGLCKDMPVLKEGKAAGKFMAPDTEAWCRNLLGNQNHLRLFETQHVLYAAHAHATLKAAEEEGYDLAALSDPAQMKALPDTERSRAKALLRRARMFGVCAAAAAIELEGAPFRKANLLGLMQSGSKQTFFDVLHGEVPHFRILIPNEQLKNGKSMTKKSRTMAPVHIEALGPADYGISILRFFIKRIRPLFPGAADTHALFPPINPTDPHLGHKTFDGWLLECSIEIGFPLTPHNFRHGVCSIQINDDPNCIEELAILLCTKPGTIRKYYAFLDRERSLRKMQAKRSERRAQHGPNRQLTAELR